MANMDFEKEVPQWENVGTEPPAEIKTGGWQAEYKPPAAYFNWFWNRVSACLTEIRAKLKGHAEDKDNPHGVTAQQLGLDKVSNTPDSEKTVKHASTADSAGKVGNNLVMRFNGGSTEGVNQWTFNGENGKAVDITPAGIGAAAADHKHPAGSGIVTTGTGAAYDATVDGITELKIGVNFMMIPHTTSTSTTATLNVNALGAKAIRRRLSGLTSATVPPSSEDWLTANKPVNVFYDGTYWIADIPRPNAPDLYGTLAVASGGTGASTAAQALVNLGAAAASHYHDELGTSNYIGFTSTVSTQDEFESALKEILAEMTTPYIPHVKSRIIYAEVNVNQNTTIVPTGERAVIIVTARFAGSGKMDYVVWGFSKSRIFHTYVLNCYVHGDSTLTNLTFGKWYKYDLTMQEFTS